MKRGNFSRYIAIIAMVLSILICIDTVKASNVSNISDRLKQYYTEIRDTQTQFSAIVEQTYANKVNHSTNSENERKLDYTNTQIKRLISNVANEEENLGNDRENAARIQLILTSAHILRDMNNSLKGYIQAENTVEQIGLLKEYFKLDAILSQLLIDLQYLEKNPIS